MSQADDNRTLPHLALEPGTKVGHYRILGPIGAGGMGEVHLADDTTLGRRVALKFLPAHLAHDPEVRARFVREAQAAAGLDHPNIVTVYEVGEFANRPYIAMQYIEGETLRHYARTDPLPVKAVIDLVACVADGLARAHAAGIIHRDIKSANILVDRELRPRLLDFGLASVQGGEQLTRAGTTLGTAAYMSPEQARGREVDHRSDLFSLGVVLYELIAGRSPFERENPAATLHSVANDDPEPLARYRRDVPAELQRIVSRALAREPGARYQSAADFAAELRTLGHALASGRAGSGGVPGGHMPTLAVLPFTNMSADPENEFFADGLTDELLNVLSRNAGLKVTGRTSAFAFKGKQEDLREIGRKLGVEKILEGSVRKAGNRVRIATQLVNAEDGFRLWSETYDRVLEDIFAVQDEIAVSVAKALDVALLGQAKVARPSNPESYALVLRAHQSVLQMTESSVGSAASMYRRAIDLDPENAAAWAGRARALARQAGLGYSDTIAASREAKECVRRALELDESLPDAWEVQGWIAAAFDFDLAGAETALRRALALAPGSSRVLGSLAIILSIVGNRDESLTAARQATELDPLDPEAHLNLARVLYWAHRPEESREACEIALALSPSMTSAPLILSWTHLMAGRPLDALAALAAEQSACYRACGLAIAYHELGRKDESDRALAELLAGGEQWAFQIAIAHAVRGEIDEAFAWLDRGRESQDSGTPLAVVHPLLEPLHADPRWPAFLARLGRIV